MLFYRREWRLKSSIIKENKRILFIFLPVFVCAIILDLLTKHFTNLNLNLGERKEFIPGFIDLINVHNDGGAWNLFSGSQIFLIVFTFIFLCFFSYFYYKERKRGSLFHLASALIYCGCVGNLIDRMAFGYVRDMIHFEFWPNFPVFNVADICVCVGMTLLVIFYLIILVKDAKRGKQKDEI